MKRMLMVMPYCNDISVYPSVYQMAQVLKATDYEVTLVTSNTIKDHRVAQYFDKIVLLPYFKKRNPVTLLINSVMFSFHILRCKVDLTMVFDHNGAEAAFIAVLMKTKVKYIYFNLEVYTGDGLKGKDRRSDRLKYSIRKNIEIYYNKKSSLFIIQDNVRYELSKKYGISHPNVLYLPNSYIYQENLDLSGNNEKIHSQVLFAGALERWTIEKLICDIEAFKNIDLTLSGWSSSGYLDEVMEKIIKYENIKVDNHQISADEYTDYLKNFNIGLVYYSWCSDENIYNMGLASGKFFKFLSLGMPVIVQRLPGLAQEVEEKGLGIVIDSLWEIESAVKKISSEYQEYQERVIKTYKERYDFKALANKIILKINKLI